MVRPNDREISPIECRQLSHVQPLGGGDNGCVDRAEGQISIAAHELGDPEPIRGSHRFDDECTRREIAEEAHLGVDSKSAADEIRDLGDDERRDDERARVVQEEIEAHLVVSVVSVDVRVERPGVDQQSYRPASEARISSIRSEMS